MRSPSNTLRIVTANDYESDIKQAEEITFDTFYPGGLFGSLSFLLRRDALKTLLIAPHQIIQVYNGPEIVWEGEVTGIIYIPGTGFKIECLGYWAGIFEARSWRKPWADTRIQDGVWNWTTTASAAEKCTYDRDNRLRFVPKNVAWLNNEGVGYKYIPPTGETVKRITFNYALAEGAQAWFLGLFNDTTAATVWSVTASGTGSVDHTFATPSDEMTLAFFSQANQTPASDGSIYGQFTDVVLYTETGSINLTEIAKDIRAHESDLSATDTMIGSNTYSLVPFVSEDETLADCILRACGYGDSDGDAWAAYITDSSHGTDGLPVLVVEQQPDLAAGFDYAINLGEANVDQGVEFVQRVDDVRNWIAVRYRDIESKEVRITPDDDATLTDAASVAAYGKRCEQLDVDTTSQTAAVAYGVRYLGQYKDPRWQSTAGITVRGWIRDASGGQVPVCRIRAGKRIKIENFLSDLSGSGLTLLITATSYSAADETCTLTVGVPDSLAVTIARFERDKQL